MGCQRLVRVSSWLSDEARVASVFSRLYHGMREGRAVVWQGQVRTGVMDTRARGGGSLSHINYTRDGSSPRAILPHVPPLAACHLERIEPRRPSSFPFSIPRDVSVSFLPLARSLWSSLLFVFFPPFSSLLFFVRSVSASFFALFLCSIRRILALSPYPFQPDSFTKDLLRIFFRYSFSFSSFSNPLVVPLHLAFAFFDRVFRMKSRRELFTFCPRSLCSRFSRRPPPGICIVSLEH